MSRSSIETELVRSLYGRSSDDTLECTPDGLDVSKRPVCGNELCEIGEAKTDDEEGLEIVCLDDCPITFKWCSLDRGFGDRLVACSGHGRCLYGSGGQCECFDGYTGDNCEHCTFGFYRLSDTDTRCLPRQNYVPLGDVTITSKRLRTEESFHAMGDGVQGNSSPKPTQWRRIL